MDRPKVFVAEDNRLVLDRVVSLLSQSDFEVIGTTDNGRDLVTRAQALNPDVIVLDIGMPIMCGIDAAHELREAGSACKLVFLTIHEEADFVQACLAEGALGYVTKSRIRTDLIPAIHEALSGRCFLSTSVMISDMAGLNGHKA